MAAMPPQAGMGFIQRFPKSTAGNKAAEIINLLDISHMSAEYMVKAHRGRNPAIWLLKVSGKLADIRKMPKEAQEQAYRMGLIPYIPGEEVTN